MPVRPRRRRSTSGEVAGRHQPRQRHQQRHQRRGPALAASAASSTSGTTASTHGHQPLRGRPPVREPGEHQPDHRPDAPAARARRREQQHGGDLPAPPHRQRPGRPHRRRPDLREVGAPGPRAGRAGRARRGRGRPGRLVADLRVQLVAGSGSPGRYAGRPAAARPRRAAGSGTRSPAGDRRRPSLARERALGRGQPGGDRLRSSAARPGAPAAHRRCIAACRIARVLGVPRDQPRRRPRPVTGDRVAVPAQLPAQHRLDQPELPRLQAVLPGVDPVAADRRGRGSRASACRPGTTCRTSLGSSIAGSKSSSRNAHSRRSSGSGSATSDS